MDDHKEYIEKSLNKNADRFRPDIVHRSILAIYDSPLSKAGLSEILIHTTDKKVIRLDKSMRVGSARLRFLEQRSASTDCLRRCWTREWSNPKSQTSSS